jgi:hypothetical protein
LTTWGVGRLPPLLALDPLLVVVLHLEVRAGGVVEQQIHFQVEEVSRRVERGPLQLLLGPQQQVHGPVQCLVVGVGWHTGRGHRGLEPVGECVLGAGIERAIGDHAEDRPFDPGGELDALAGRHLLEVAVDLQPLPQPSQEPGGAHGTALDEMDRLPLDRRGRRLELVLGTQETGDRADQPAQRLEINLLAAAEVEEDLGLGGVGLGVAAVVRELDVGGLGAVLVGARRDPQVHDYMIGV